MKKMDEPTSAPTRIRPWIRVTTICSLALSAILLFLLLQDDPKTESTVDSSPQTEANITEPPSSPVPTQVADEVTSDGFPVPDFSPADDGPFLESDFEPLNKWLNERFEVSYKHMTLDLIFDQVPLNDIFYEVLVIPGNADEFSLESSDISRRELLEKIARHWDLEMSYVIDDSGTPTAVRVVGPDFL